MFDQYCSTQPLTEEECVTSVFLGFICLAICAILVLYTLDRLFFYPKRNLARIKVIRNKVGTYNANSQRIQSLTPVLNGTTNISLDKIELPAETPNSTTGDVADSAGYSGSTNNSSKLDVIPSDGVTAIISSIATADSSIHNNYNHKMYDIDETPIVTDATPTVSHAKLIRKLGKIEKEAETILELKRVMVISIMVAMVFGLITVGYLILSISLFNEIGCQYKQAIMVFYGMQRIGLYNCFIESLEASFRQLNFDISKNFTLSYKAFMMASILFGVCWYLRVSFNNIDEYNTKCFKSDIEVVILYCVVIDILCRLILMSIFCYKLCELYLKQEIAVTPAPTPAVDNDIDPRENNFNLGDAQLEIPNNVNGQTEFGVRLDMNRALNESRRVIKKYVILLSISLIVSIISYTIMIEVILIAICFDLVLNNICLLNWLPSAKLCILCDKQQ